MDLSTMTDDELYELEYQVAQELVCRRNEEKKELENGDKKTST